jgi:hypothetical protein
VITTICEFGVLATTVQLSEEHFRDKIKQIHLHVRARSEHMSALSGGEAAQGIPSGELLWECKLGYGRKVKEKLNPQSRQENEDSYNYLATSERELNLAVSGLK